MIDLIESRLDVKLHHPVELPTPLSGDSYCLFRRPSRPVSIRIRMEYRIENRFHSLYRFRDRFWSNIAMVSSSMPAAPRLALTCWYASHTSRFAIPKDFVDFMSLIPAPQVGGTRQPDNAAPSLHSRYRRFIATMSSPDPRSGIGILPHGVCHLSFPFTSRTKFSRSIPKPVLSSCRLYTGCH